MDGEPQAPSIEESKLFGLQRMRAYGVVPLTPNPYQIPLGTGDDSGLEYGVNPNSDPKRHPFEVYIIGYTSNAETTARCQMAWGTVRAAENVELLATVTDLDTTFTLTSGNKVWLETTFSVASNIVTISSCAVKVGDPLTNGWTGYPKEFKYTNTTTYKWFHLIAYVRAAKRGKDPLQSPTPNHPYPDSGEFPVIKPGLVIAQCTNTHLVTQQQCMIDYDVTPNLIRSGARLVPGPGGVIT